MSLPVNVNFLLLSFCLVFRSCCFIECVCQLLFFQRKNTFVHRSVPMSVFLLSLVSFFLLSVPSGALFFFFSSSVH